jgi:hypothetical protein
MAATNAANPPNKKNHGSPMLSCVVLISLLKYTQKAMKEIATIESQMRPKDLIILASISRRASQRRVDMNHEYSLLAARQSSDVIRVEPSDTLGLLSGRDEMLLRA